MAAVLVVESPGLAVRGSEAEDAPERDLRSDIDLDVHVQDLSDLVDLEGSWPDAPARKGSRVGWPHLLPLGLDPLFAGHAVPGLLATVLLVGLADHGSDLQARPLADMIKRPPQAQAVAYVLSSSGRSHPQGGADLLATAACTPAAMHSAGLSSCILSIGSCSRRRAPVVSALVIPRESLGVVDPLLLDGPHPVGRDLPPGLHRRLGRAVVLVSVLRLQMGLAKPAAFAIRMLGGALSPSHREDAPGASPPCLVASRLPRHRWPRRSSLGHLGRSSPCLALPRRSLGRCWRFWRAAAPPLQAALAAPRCSLRPPRRLPLASSSSSFG